MSLPLLSLATTPTIADGRFALPQFDHHQFRSPRVPERFKMLNSGTES
jgi:hypothetical protein